MADIKLDRPVTYQQAKRALELFDSEYIGQDGQELWEWAVKTAIAATPVQKDAWNYCEIYVQGVRVQ